MAEVGTIHGLTPSEIDKIYGQDAGTLAKVLGLDFSQTVKIPAGVILPLRGAGAVPSGWSLFSSADNKYIVGAGTTYSPGNNGAGTGNVNLTDVATGSHTGNIPRYGWNPGQTGLSANANHGHTTMTFTQPLPYYTGNRLIKANSEQDQLPQDACIMKHSSGGWTGLTHNQPTGGNRFFRAQAADGIGGKYTQTITSSTTGAHNHGTTDGTLPAGSDNNSNQAIVTYGGHYHSFSATVAINTKYRLLSLWYNASGAYDLVDDSYIGMYESLTPPDGWALCNGSNGTPDMRDWFLLSSYSDTPGGSGNNNTLTCSTTTDYAGSHNHYSRQCNSCDNRFRYHSDYQMNHYHTISHNQSWIPPYYALAFIMYTGQEKT